MKLRTRILYSGLCAAAVAALAVTPASAETRAGTSTNTGIGVQAGGVGVNANTGLSADLNNRGTLENQTGANTYTRTRVNTAADAKLDTNNNGFLDENEISLSSSARANTRAATRGAVDNARPRDIGNMGIQSHSSSDNRVGASYGND